MARSGDFGDKFPGDAGDTAPGNPIGNLNESSDQLQSSTPQSHTEKGVFEDILDAEEDTPEIREVYTATIIEEIDEDNEGRRQFIVAAQTGQNFIAYAPQLLFDSETYIFDQPVAIIAGQQENEWSIVAVPQPRYPDIRYVRFQETQLPGEIAKVKVLVFEDDIWGFGPETTVHDPLICNFHLKDEDGFIQNSRDGERLEQVGSKGLMRKARARENIDIDDFGDAEIISDFEDDYGVRTETLSGVIVEVENNWSGDSILSNEKLWIKWEPYEGILKKKLTPERRIGNWVIFKASAIKCDVIRFTTESIDVVGRTATGNVTAVPNGCELADVPEVDEAGNVVICDPTGCFFNETSDEVGQRDGWARYMQPLGLTVCQPNVDDYDYLTPQWEVFSLCCPIPAC